MKLSPAQQTAKDNLRRARQAQKTARSAFEAEMEIAWRERSARVTEDVLNAVAEAVRLKVPKTQIGQAYGSKDGNTIRRLIEQVKTKQTHHVESMVHVEYIEDENRFTITLHNFDDWTDPENGPEAVSGEVRYVRNQSPSAMDEWFPEAFNDLTRAVERELWSETPLRQEVARHVPLDSLPDVGQDDDYEDTTADDDLPGMWEPADFR